MSIMRKPLVLKKMLRAYRLQKQQNGQIGDSAYSVIIDYDNRCNLHCAFCYERALQRQFGREHLSWAVIENFADQADDLGYYDITLQGGELLLNPPSLYKLIEIIKPERFEISLVTNGYLMTQEIANRLAELKVDNVGVSMSTLNSEEHDKSRGVKGSHQRALKAMEYIERAGMLNWPSGIVGHNNICSPEFEAFLAEMDRRGYLTFLNYAMPYGEWNQNEDVVMTDADVEHLMELRKKYRINMDWWMQQDPKRQARKGCCTVNRIFLTPLGDVLPCPYIHISLGNIKEKPLKEIIDYGFSIKWFHDYQNDCLAARNREFRDKFLKDERDIFHPIPASEAFGKEDFISKP